MVATVTDPTGLDDSIVVVITAEDRNEDPVLSGRPELMINEIDGGDERTLVQPATLSGTQQPQQSQPQTFTNVVDEDHRASATDQWAPEGRGRRSVPAYRYRRTHPCLQEPTGLRKPG